MQRTHREVTDQHGDQLKRDVMQKGAYAIYEGDLIVREMPSEKSDTTERAINV